MSKASQGNFQPLAHASMYVGIMMASDFLREMIQHSFDGDDRKRGWGMMERTLDGIHRSGLLGMYTTIPDMLKTHQFGRSVPAQMAGTSTSQLEQWYRAISGQGSMSTAVKRAIPGNQLFIDPPMNWGRWLTAKTFGDVANETMDVPLVNSSLREAITRN